ncbi:MAG: STAS domain-containing protein [Actinobacteria bacterium]|nr:STAS domain-containing protein [Actinomycetota bacterium]
MTIRQQGDVTIVSLEGSAGAALFSGLQDDVLPACPSQAVVVDITSLTIAGSHHFRQLTAFLHWSSETLSRVGLVCRRVSARRLLHRSGAAEVIPVFMTVEEAVEALLAQGSPTPDGSSRAVAAEAGGRSGRSLAGRVVRTKRPGAPRYARPMGGEGLR